ncbi:hypothetical protein [Nocardia sp. NPDC050406]|uniref:DUF7373 family lipoprotein n=1 Tax=Nocardia sp. NPDC050406 TaxID=3364318 RepID=UPI0037A647DA
MRFRFHRLAAAAMAAAIAGTAVACGETDTAPQRFGAADDFGPYSTQRIDTSYDTRSDLARGRIAESLRLGEHIAFGSDIAPEVAAQRYTAVPVGERGAWFGLQAHQMTAAEPFRPYAGFVSESAGSPNLGAHLAHPMVKITLIAFPDDAAATAAAAAMSASDFALNNANTPVSLPELPTALSHWVPTQASVGSWMAYKSVVIHVVAQSIEKKLDPLTSLLTETYQQQVRELADYTPATAPVETIPLDPDKLLPNLVATGNQAPDAREFAVYGPRAFAVLSSTDPATQTREYESRKVEAVAISDNKYLYALPDAETAKNFTTYLTETPTASKYVRMGGISGIDEIACFQATEPNPTESQARRYRCLIPHANFVAEVFSDRETDVRQLAAAQYSLLKDGE